MPFWLEISSTKQISSSPLNLASLSSQDMNRRKTESLLEDNTDGLWSWPWGSVCFPSEMLWVRPLLTTSLSLSILFFLTEWFSKLYLQYTGASQPEAPDSSLLQTSSNSFYDLIYYSSHLTSQGQLPIKVTFLIVVTEYLTRRTYKNSYFGSRYEGAVWCGGKKWDSWSQWINNLLHHRSRSQTGSRAGLKDPLFPVTHFLQPGSLS